MSFPTFNQTIDTWIEALRYYSLEDLTVQPSPGSWSMGQLYNHLINETRYYISRIDVCISSNRNAGKEMSDEGKTMFRNNSFPNARLIGALSHSSIPQPGSKQELIEQVIALRKAVNEKAILMEKTVFNGKAKHPGLDYLNASEWIQFADMHMRHHLRQKKAIDAFLATLSSH